MESQVLKERNQIFQPLFHSKNSYSSPKKSTKSKNENFSPDMNPVIKSITVKSNEIQFEEKFPEKSKIRYRKHYCVSDKEVLSLRYDNSDSYIANGTTDGCIKLLNVKTGKVQYVFTPPDQVEKINASISCLRWKPTNNDILLSANTYGELKQYKISDYSLISQLKEENNEIYALDYHMKNDIFATAGRDAAIRIYDENTKKQIHKLIAKQWVSPGHTNRIFSIKFINDDPNVLISGGWDNSVYIWDTRLKKSVDSIYGVCLMGDSLDYKNNQILIGNQKNKEQLQLYDYKTRNIIKIIDWESGFKMDGITVYTAQFSKTNSDYIVAGASGGFNQMKIFSKKANYEPIFCANYLPKGCYTSDFGNITNSLAFGGGEGYVYLCSYSNI